MTNRIPEKREQSLLPFYKSRCV